MIKIKKNSLFIILLSIVFCVATVCFTLSVNNAFAQIDVPTVQIINGASVRNTEEDGGIRFSALVNVNCFNQGTTTLKSGYDAGMLIIDKDGYDEAEKLDHTLDRNTYKIQDIKAVTWHTTSQYTNENQIAFNAVIKVPKKAYASTLMLTARAYVYDGTNYYYSDTVTRCMAQVSSIALAQGWEDTFGALEEHVDNANGDFSVNGQSDDVIDVTLKVGESISPVATPEYLAVALSCDNQAISVADGKISAIAKSDEPVEVIATLGSKTKTINVTIDSSDVDAELLGAYYTNVDNLFGRVEAGYTCDTEKLSSGATVGLHFKANNWVAKPDGSVSEPAYIHVKTDANLKANTTYTLRYKVTKIAQTSGPDFGWNVCVGTTKDSYKALNDASSDLGGSANIYARRLIFTTTSAVDGMNFVVIIAPNAFTDIEFTMTDISIVEGDDYFSSVSTNTIKTKIYADENLQPIINMKGSSDVPNDSAVNIATNVNLEANKEYVLTCKFNIVNAVRAKTTNIHWGINFYNSADNFKSAVQFNVASKLGEASANTYVGASCVDKATVLSFNLAPTQDVTNFIFRVYIHGTYMSEFEFEVSDIFVIDKSALSNDLMGATLNSTNTNSANMFNYKLTANYVTDKDLLVTGNDYGVLLDKKSTDSIPGNYGARFKLDKVLTAGTAYDITFKVIDIGLAGSSGSKWYVAFGLNKEYLGDSVDGNIKQLQEYMNDGYVTTEKINGVTVYTITVKNHIAKNDGNAQFNMYIVSSKLAQKCIVTGISITESATAN